VTTPGRYLLKEVVPSYKSKASSEAAFGSSSLGHLPPHAFNKTGVSSKVGPGTYQVKSPEEYRPRSAKDVGFGTSSRFKSSPGWGPSSSPSSSPGNGNSRLETSASTSPGGEPSPGSATRLPLKSSDLARLNNSSGGSSLSPRTKNGTGGGGDTHRTTSSAISLARTQEKEALQRRVAAAQRLRVEQEKLRAEKEAAKRDEKLRRKQQAERSESVSDYRQREMALAREKREKSEEFRRILNQRLQKAESHIV
jgi:hypothetical protein